jgi:ATP-dependent protease Clp ATPase subunit
MIAKMKARGVRCSFCGKSRSEVSNIVAGAPHAANSRRNKSSFICNECVRRFNQLLASSEVTDKLVSASTLK